MTQETQLSIAETLKAKFGDDILSTETPFDFLTIYIRKEKITEIIQFLHDAENLQFRFLTDLCGVHFPDAGEKFMVVYHLHSLTNNYRIRLKAAVGGEHPEVQSITGIFPSANWMERETFDFYGILFKGHPNLKRILNVDDMLIFPLRKEFPLEDQVRLDKNDAQFGR
ncbi:MAG: NADH-quinone oxidoreductase subunit C [Bacteroidetes bacterium]|nr:NADH-quinone oxidoreductase subunit C [Bacteroidota bacterium]